MKLKILPSNVLFEQFDIQENELEKRLANLPKFGDTIQDFTFIRPVLWCILPKLKE